MVLNPGQYHPKVGFGSTWEYFLCYTSGMVWHLVGEPGLLNSLQWKAHDKEIPHSEGHEHPCSDMWSTPVPAFWVCDLDEVCLPGCLQNAILRLLIPSSEWLSHDITHWWVAQPILYRRREIPMDRTIMAYPPGPSLSCHCPRLLGVQFLWWTVFWLPACPLLK